MAAPSQLLMSRRLLPAHVDLLPLGIGKFKIDTTHLVVPSCNGGGMFDTYKVAKGAVPAAAAEEELKDEDRDHYFLLPVNGTKLAPMVRANVLTIGDVLTQVKTTITKMPKFENMPILKITPYPDTETTVFNPVVNGQSVEFCEDTKSVEICQVTKHNGAPTFLDLILVTARGTLKYHSGTIAGIGRHSNDQQIGKYNTHQCRYEPALDGGDDVAWVVVNAFNQKGVINDHTDVSFWLYDPNHAERIYIIVARPSPVDAKQSAIGKIKFIDGKFTFTYVTDVHCRDGTYYSDGSPLMVSAVKTDLALLGAANKSPCRRR